MPVPTLTPALSFLAAFNRMSPTLPLRTFLRTTSEKFRPSRLQPYISGRRPAQECLLATGRAESRQLSTVWFEPHSGPQPTIVIGGFVPNSTDQVFLLRGHLLKSGPIYYLNYSPAGFSLDLFCAQLDDLLAELSLSSLQPPVLFGVSFGAGLVMAWLHRRRFGDARTPIGGVILVSPVACTADLIAPGAAKPKTLLGRAVQPYMQEREEATAAGIEKSRAIFTRMFEAGAQNKAALRLILTREEFARLRTAVMATITGISLTGARERVRALCQMTSPAAYETDPTHPLTDAPVLILYAEKEDSVLDAAAPTRHVLLNSVLDYFPQGMVRTISNLHGAPVQHASLIFHYLNFLPAISSFYRRLKSGKIRIAA
jgi:pimeloyl-ACP methyl ester carboxylesterase